MTALPAERLATQSERGGERRETKSHIARLSWADFKCETDTTSMELLKCQLGVFLVTSPRDENGDVVRIAESLHSITERLVKHQLP